MKEYQFEYTRTWVTLFVIFSCIAIFTIADFFCLYLKLNFLVAIVPSLGLAFLLFKILKGIAIHSCLAKLDNDSVSFEFEDKTRVLNFSELTKYKLYDGRNGVILSLKTTSNSLKITANNNFCRTEDIKSFCKDLMFQIDRYKKEDKKD